MNFLYITIFLLWMAVVIKNSLFWTALWQEKEYRRDRVKAHFELPSGRKIIFNKKTAILSGLFFISLFQVEFIRIAMAVAVLILYGAFTAFTVKHLQEKTLKLPYKTARAVTIASATIALYIAISAFVFLEANEWFLPWLLIGDLLTLLFVSFFVSLSSVPVTILRKRLSKKAAKKRKEMKDLLVIGVAGSYGKTSIVELLYFILADEFNVLKTPKHTGSEIKIASLINDKLKSKHNIFIAELSAHKKSEIKNVARIIQPQMSILTGINEQHLSIFKNKDNVKKEMHSLVKALPPKGLALFNTDDSMLRKIFDNYSKPKRAYGIEKYGEGSQHPIRLASVQSTKQGTAINIEENGDYQTLTTSLIGRHNALNILAAVTIARELGMSYEDIKSALYNFKSPAKILRERKGIKDSIILDDTSHANVDGVLAALDSLHNIGGRQKIMVFHPLNELGTQAIEVHKKIARKIAEVCDWCVVTSPDYYSVMTREAVRNGMSKKGMICMPKPHEALRKSQELIDAEDVVLLENSIPKTVTNGLILHTNED